MQAFGTTIIILIFLLGGVIAFIGNILGRSMGKKRLSIFRLRPRYTATLFTIFAGVLIAALTLGISASISRNFRTALFGLDELRDNLVQTKRALNHQKEELDQKLKEKNELDFKLHEINLNLKKAQEKINSLYLAKEKLAEEVSRTRKGNLLFRKGDVLLTSLIKSPSKLKNPAIVLKQLLSVADQRIRSYEMEIEKEKHLLYCSPTDFDIAVEKLKAEKRSTIIQLFSTRNTLWGETIHCNFKFLPNALIFKKGEEIAYTSIDGKLELPSIEQQIMLLLKQAHLTAKQHGILPDINGNMGSIPYTEITNLSKKIHFYKRKFEVAIIAQKDIYTIGPLEVSFKTFY